MKIIDRYIQEISIRLPRKLRSDVEAEIRSSIEDTLEDRCQEMDCELIEEMAAEVITELGSPQKVADSYLPPRFLIGPRMFPLFMLVAKIVFMVFTIMFFIGVVFNLVQVPIKFHSISGDLGLSFLSYLEALFSSFGWIVLIFAIIERIFPGAKGFDPDEEEAKWKSEDLLKTESPELIKLWESVLRILGASAFIVIFNFYPHWVGAFNNAHGVWSFVPLLSSGFAVYLPWLNLLWALSIIFSFMLIRKGEWTPFTRWFNYGIEIYTIGLLLGMILGKSIVGFNPEYLAIHGLTLDTIPGFIANNLSNLQFGVVGIMLIIVTVSAVTLIIDMIRMFRTGGAPVIKTN